MILWLRDRELAKDTSLFACLIADHIPVPISAVFYSTYLGIVIHPHEAHAMVVAASPFEVVDHRPHEITAHIGTFCDGFFEFCQVMLEILDALFISNASWLDDDVIVTGTILGDIDHWCTVLSSVALQQFAQPFWIGLLPQDGMRDTRRRISVDPGAEEGQVPGVPGVLPGVIIDAQKIGFNRDRLHIAGQDLRSEGP